MAILRSIVAKKWKLLFSALYRLNLAKFCDIVLIELIIQNIEPLYRRRLCQNVSL